MKKVLILIILIVILIVLIVGWLVLRGYQHQTKKEEARVITYKTEYPEGENPKIKIENNTDKKFCFSSCYPYYLEKNNGEFKSYNYSDCPEADTVENCIEPGQIKAFELILDKMEIDQGPHRVAIPACINCALQENFRKDTWFYSNEFIIK